MEGIHRAEIADGKEGSLPFAVPKVSLSFLFELTSGHLDVIKTHELNSCPVGVFVPA